LFDYIIEEDRHAVMELMAKYNSHLYNIVSSLVIRFKITRNSLSLDSPIMRVEVAGLRSDDQVIPVEVGLL
jgi:hypothetical protein